MSAIVWFRRDLRLHEHPALRAALDAHDDVVPVFCFDERLLHGRHASGSRTQFLLESLADLDGSLRERGSGLVVRNGPPERTLAALAEEIKAEELHFTADITPFARQRGERVRKAFDAARLALHGHPGLSVINDIGAPLTQAGKPYSVFSAFHRSWEREPARSAGRAAPTASASIGPRQRRDPIPCVARPRAGGGRTPQGR